VRIEMRRRNTPSGSVISFATEAEGIVLTWYPKLRHMWIARTTPTLPFLIDFVAEADIPEQKVLLRYLLEDA
jgi:hypothetical protein